MEFGVFDHLDRSGAGLPDQYNQRLNLVELYDRLEFYCYHIAEHHFTPLGMAPSPSVFLASAIQRTQRLRVGPLVYLLPLYHPLRLLEEICMLDNLSGGRMQVGVGRGISPFELGYYGRNVEESKDVFEENLSILLEGFRSESLSYQGRFGSFDQVPMSLRPVQRPHPPIWMGINSIESAAFAAKSGFNIVGLMPAAAMRSRVDAYRQATATGSLGEQKVGICYMIVVGDDEATANAHAGDAYRRWHHSFHQLYHLHGKQPVLGMWPETFGGLVEQKRAIAGTPDTVTVFLRQQIELSGINYVVAQLMFGELPDETARRSVTLFGTNVIPALKA